MRRALAPEAGRASVAAMIRSIPLLLLVAGGLGAAEKAYVQRPELAVYRDPGTSRCPVVATLRQGDEVRTGERKGAQVLVTLADQRSGWASAAALADRKPQAESLASRLGSATRDDGRGLTAAAAGRTIAEEAKAYAAQRGAAAAAADVEKMEKVKIPAAALDTFMEEGRIGDYRP